MAKTLVQRVSPMSFDRLRALLISLRPHQWSKNTLVFGGAVFSRSLLDWNMLWLASLAFVVFCMASSGIYLLNDLRDLETDRAHPVKRLRPLAAGQLSPVVAGFVGSALVIVAILAAISIGKEFAVIMAAYLTLTGLYSLGLKRIVILDVMIVAAGFVLRAVAGAAAIAVPVSPWLILCTMMLALVVSFGKRRHELILLEGNARTHRPSLGEYSPQFLDQLMVLSGAAAIVTYALYTMADDTVLRFGSHALVLTTPFVLYGILRYLYLVQQKAEGGDPARLLVTDLPSFVNGVLWIASVCGIIYGGGAWVNW